MPKYPMTAAIRWLHSKNIPFEPFLYRYKDKGGAKWAAETLNVHVHSVIKTIVLEDENHNAFIVLMHGDCEVSTKKMARTLCCKFTKLCLPKKVQSLTGYLVGGCSPFATKTQLPLYCEQSISHLDNIWLNAGKRGFLIKISFSDLKKFCEPKFVSLRDV